MPWLTGGHTEALKACVLGGKENEDGGRTQAPAKVLSQMSEAATCAQRWGGCKTITVIMVLICTEHLSGEITRPLVQARRVQVWLGSQQPPSQ